MNELGMKLLVSVRNAREANIALQEGVDIIDLKEPDHGPLGQVAETEIQGIAKLVMGHLPLSVALGELAEAPRPFAHGMPHLFGVSFAKIGLAYCNSIQNWQGLWNQWAGQLPSRTAPVAVAYADNQSCDAPPLEAVADFALQTKTRVFLIDTCNKSLGSTFDHVSCEKLTSTIRELQSHSVQVALAGSLKHHDIPQIAQIEPDIVAVRGVVCHQNNRQSQICPASLRAFRAALGIT